VRIAGLEVAVDCVCDENLCLGYRTRAEFHGDGTRLGFYALRSRRVVDVAQCPLCHVRLNAALERLRATTREGAIELMVNPEGTDTLAWTMRPNPKLRTAFPLANSLYGRGRRSSFLFDGTPIVNGTFTQSSLLLNRLLRQTVCQVVGTPSSLLDLYCGNGNLSLSFADSARVLGLDHNRAAVRAAEAIGAGTYRVGDESAFRKALHTETWAVVLLDPPRTGAKGILDALVACEAQHIVYVSCDPATLARDAKRLAEHGWRVARLRVVDLFPNTAHIESVCQFER